MLFGGSPVAKTDGGNLSLPFLSLHFRFVRSKRVYGDIVVFLLFIFLGCIYGITREGRLFRDTFRFNSKYFLFLLDLSKLGVRWLFRSGDGRSKFLSPPK